VRKVLKTCARCGHSCFVDSDVDVCSRISDEDGYCGGTLEQLSDA
jgi:hypothetical protein